MLICFKGGITVNAIVNYPKNKEDIKELENNIATFHATLIIEKIKKLNVSERDKKKILNGILNIIEKQNL